MDTGELFRELTGFEPYDYQVRAWKAIEGIMEFGGKVVIEVPTAGGKTEAAVMPFLAGVYHNSWPVARLVYVLPTRSLVENQAERMRKHVSNLLQLRGKPEKEAMELAEKLVVVEYGLERTHAFLGWIIITTWDAFLYGLAAHRTVGDRFTFPAGAIAQSLVVFDEVQMYQDESMYMPRLLSLVVGILERANIPVVVMSATIPSKLREMITGNAKTITVEKGDKNRPSRGNVDIKVVEGDVIDVLGDIREALKEGKKVLVVRNIVARAVETYRFLRSELRDVMDPSSVLLLHSRFTTGDRKEKENAIESAKLIVSTQVVEAGLDLPNVGLVVTNIAPLDALIQRIGRCARRPSEKGEGIVLLPTENEGIESEKIVKGLSELKSRLNVRGEITFATVTTTKDYGNRAITVAEIYTEGDTKKGKRVCDIKDAKKILEKKGGKRKAKLPKELYALPYSAVPYDPLVLLTTYDELGDIKEYLSDTERAREALNRVYRFHYENNIVPREFASAYVYFRELKLFSAPPEYELRSRPELYVILYPTTEEEVERLEVGKVIRISYSRRKLGEWKEKGIITGKLQLQWDEKKKRISKWKVQKKFKLNAYGIYALNPEYYSPETGFTPEISGDENEGSNSLDGRKVSAQTATSNDFQEKSSGKRDRRKGGKARQATLVDLGVVK
ncbi:CRISPR-associated helicase Cas3' [Thermococcus sp.]|uniref:CRISPR-associated helicase Cas3' n=1 Tax=Thermococcus sp. TaxID=35749 RepID=UPI0025FFBA64|nr:CRISPR-associated helicase Cas3' [Thermococcus sp.]